MDSYELLTVICEELSDTVTVGELRRVAPNISEHKAAIKIAIKSFYILTTEMIKALITPAEAFSCVPSGGCRG